MTTNNNSSNSSSILGILAFGIVGFAVYYFAFKEPSFYKVMQQKAIELNELAPIMVDKSTRFDSVMAFKNNTYQYNYTMEQEDLDYMDVEERKKNLTPVIIQNVKTDPQLEIFRDHETTLEFNYNDANGKHIFNIVVTPEDYLEEAGEE